MPVRLSPTPKEEERENHFSVLEKRKNSRKRVIPQAFARPGGGLCYSVNGNCRGNDAVQGRGIESKDMKPEGNHR